MTSVATRELPGMLIVRLASLFDATGFDHTVTTPELAPAGTEPLDAVMALVLDVAFKTAPPQGAPRDSVAVAVAPAPPTTDDGASVRPINVGPG